MNNKSWLGGALLAVALMLSACGVDEALVMDEQATSDVSVRQEGGTSPENGTQGKPPSEIPADEKEGTVTPMGFGCPFNEYQCHSHCQSIKMRGGYCTNTFRQTCVCYK